MTPTLMKLETVAVAEVHTQGRLRPVSAAAVASLVASITELGVMKDAIHVRKKHSGELHLIAGAHRLQAAAEMGWAEVPAKVWTNVTDDWARLMEVDDNIAGAELTALDTAVFLAERKRLYEKLHPETVRGIAGAAGRWDASDTMSLACFADATAEKFGLTKRHVQRMVAAGGALSPQEAQQLREAQRPVTLKDLQVIAKVKPAERREIVAQLVVGEAKSAADALKRHQQATGQAPVKLDLDPVEAAFKALREAWSRAPKAAKRRFVAETFPEMETLAHELVAEGWEADGSANDTMSFAVAPADTSEIAAQ